ncbi:MAG: AAA family ATPase [Firmicutes bacterium]|nr:AAA family ATPase [Bacillota bacterium]
MSIYLETFRFPEDEAQAVHFLWDEKAKKSCYTSYYPFKILSSKGFERIDFEEITILHGGNGCGKTTALNVIAETLGLQRKSRFNQSAFFRDYTELCVYEEMEAVPEGSCIITSDDVFDYMLDIRALNEGIDEKREELFSEYTELKYSDFQLDSMSQYEQLKKINRARSKTQSGYVKSFLMDNARERSNGETALMYFSEKLVKPGLYLLDEPENSLSAENQIKLQFFLEEAAHYSGCQLVISTHSPFLLAMRGAKIYDLDEEIVDVKQWTELPNIRCYYEFFKQRADEF